jgi:hypothetical protein
VTVQELAGTADVGPEERATLGWLSETLAELRSAAESLAAELQVEVAGLTPWERYRAALAERILPVSLIDRGTGVLQQALVGQERRWVRLQREVAALREHAQRLRERARRLHEESEAYVEWSERVATWSHDLAEQRRRLAEWTARVLAYQERRLAPAAPFPVDATPSD